MAFQETAASTSWLFMRGIYRPMISFKVIRSGNTCSGSTNSSSISAAATSRASSNKITHPQYDVIRPLENFPLDIWGDRFITLPFTNSEFELCSKKVQDLKKMVEDMLKSSADDPIENILLINSLCRLGVSYHYETEIENLLSHLFSTLPQLMDIKDLDLHIVAIIFQVFRSHGYKMPCDVFNKFKKGDTFKEELASDGKGILSLYEASQWGTHGECILDEALAFTALHLESMLVSQSCPHHLKEYIGNALKFPYHKGMPRMEARQYVTYYEKTESRNDMLLEFAKYDFNRVQMLYQKELSLLSSWWKKLNIASKLPHIRQRIVESYLIAVSVLFEPRFALARNIMSKWYVVLGLMDDTYDAYGLFEELLPLRTAMERWDMSAMDELPGDYLKNIYQTFMHISDEVEETVRKEGGSFSILYNKEEVKKVVQAYHVQARWLHEQIMPTFDEYLENGIWSVGTITTLSLLMMGMPEADENAYNWLVNCDATILRPMCILSRLYNDMQTNEDEEKRGGQISGTACYMRENGVSKKEAIEGFQERIKVAWKDMNEGFSMVRPTPIPKQLLMAAMNIARASEVCYKDSDGFTKPEIAYKYYMTKVLVDPIPLDE